MRASFGIAILCVHAALAAAAAPRIAWRPARPEIYTRFEIVVQAPPGERPFDPDAADLSVTFTLPSGRKVTAPGFYYAPYERVLVKDEKGEDTEKLIPAGRGDWRVRYCPVESGVHRFLAVFRQQGLTRWIWSGQFRTRPTARPGFVRVDPSSRRFFQFDNGAPLFLLGECCCWGGKKGTFSYDDWFAIHQSSGMNGARIWMSPWAFGIEARPGSLNRYALDQAWALDYVVELAERLGIYLILCLDYHGMLKTVKDQWGKNDNWRRNPYNRKLGGPCAAPGDFFTSPQARALYKKRLRYIAARWGYSTHILAWELWNEVDLTYSERGVNPRAVEAWHREMAAYLKRVDPNRHMVTTSFYSDRAGDRLWRASEMDFVQSHCYNRPDPAGTLTRLARDMSARYHKPFLVGEYGVDSAGAKRTLKKDPLGQALHQALWASAFSGAAGAAMPWWWDNYIHPEGLYVIWRNLSDFLEDEPMGSPATRLARFETAPPPAPASAAFTQRITPETDWSRRAPAEVIDVLQPSPAPLVKRFHAFLQGRRQRRRRRPIRLRAWFGPNGGVRLHLNSVARGAVLVVSVDGRTVFRRYLRDRDRRAKVRNEYNITLFAPAPPGWRTVIIENQGKNWLYLDWIEVVNALPCAGPPARVRPFGLLWPDRAIVWLLNERASWPQRPSSLARRGRVILRDLPNGRYDVEWRDPPSNAVLSRVQTECRDGKLLLEPPEFLYDIAAKVHPAR